MLSCCCAPPSIARSAGVLGEASSDGFDRKLLAEEPLDKVQEVLREARRIHGL